MRQYEYRGQGPYSSYYSARMCSSRKKRLRIPDQTNHFQSISYPHARINIKFVACDLVQTAMQLHAIRLNPTRTTNTFTNKLQTVT